MQTGLVIKSISSFFYVKYNKEIYECRASKKLKQNKKQIITGDLVSFDLATKYIEEVLPRTNELIRPKVSNVNNGVLVFSLVEPEMNYSLLNKMLLIMEKNQLAVSLVITKVDLVSDEVLEQFKQEISYYETIGYQVFYSNELERLEKHLQGDKYVFTGQTGVGKSTLLNKLIPDLNLQTQEISKALGRGKHTTREITFYDYHDGFIIDTPGFSSLEITLSKEDIRDNYVDYWKLGDKCRFKGCYHLQEPECNVKKNINYDDKVQEIRYRNYVNFMDNVKEYR